MAPSNPAEEPRSAVRQVIEAIAGATGPRFYPTLVQAVARSLRVMAGLCALRQGDRLELVALFDGEPRDRSRLWDPLGPPWTLALEAADFVRAEGARHEFPGDPWLDGFRTEGLCAVPIRSRSGDSLGLLAILHPGPLAEPARALSLLSFAALRAAAELERHPDPFPELASPCPELALPRVPAVPIPLYEEAQPASIAPGSEPQASLPEPDAAPLAALPLAPAVEPTLERESEAAQAKVSAAPRETAAVRSAETDLRAYIKTLERGNAELERARDAADQALRTHNDSLVRLSHEVRTPLSAILGFAEMLLGGTEDAEHTREALHTIQCHGENLLEAMDEVVRFARLSLREAVPVLEECALPELLRELQNYFAPRAREKGIEFAVRLETPIPELLRTDPACLREALHKLVHNAIKYTQRGQVELAARFVASAHIVELDVLDMGVGIPSDALPRIFEPFFRVDSSSTRRVGGTGLGLPIAKRLVEAIDGRIHARSEVGRGSRFRVALPCSGTSDALVSKLPEPGARSSDEPLGLHILIVDDSPDLRRLLRRMLEGAGCQVTTAQNGAEAVDLALAKPQGFDVILMDIQMPVLDGREATRRLRARGYDRPIVALTADAFAAERGYPARGGFDAHATKPLDRRALLNLVARF